MAAPGFINASLSVAAGGAFGSWARYATGVAIGRMGGVGAQFPWSTLAVNVVGSLAMGLLAGWLARHGTGGEAWRLLLGVGVLGGFTTFSAFSLELALMIERGALISGAAYAGISLIAGVGALFAGLAVMRTFA
ncbi:MAG: fluoride efflux transporter CrcB [Novosphingobium sp.]